LKKEIERLDCVMRPAAPLIGENVLRLTETTSKRRLFGRNRSGRSMTRLVRSSSGEVTHSSLLG